MGKWGEYERENGKVAEEADGPHKSEVKTGGVRKRIQSERRDGITRWEPTKSMMGSPVINLKVCRRRWGCSACMRPVTTAQVTCWASGT